MYMCRWMESNFHGWVNCNRVAFSLELLEWDRTFSGFGDQKIQVGRDFKMGRFFLKFNQCVNSFQDDVVKWLYKADA